MTQKFTNQAKNSVINSIFIGFVVIAILVGGYNNRLAEVSEASFESAKTAVNLAINLVGVMALWLGLVRVLEAGGLMYTLAFWLKPLMWRLFPEVPVDSGAMGAMILNFAANLLGLGNAATPLGIKAMIELNKLNPSTNTATNAMCLFLAINTSSITLFPLTVIGIRAASESSNPAAIWLPTLLSTITSTAVAVAVCFWFTRKNQTMPIRVININGNYQEEESALITENSYQHLLYKPDKISLFLAILFILAFLGAAFKHLQENNWLVWSSILSDWLIPGLILLIVAYGLARGVKVYEAVTEGAKQGFEIAIGIIPFLVAILVAIAMFRASGAMDIFIELVNPVTSWLRMPPETLPMALIRPLSGGGALGIMSEIIERDPDSYSAFVVSTMMGSTETTFYVLAVYLGSVGITRSRHTLVAALLADVAGILSACLWSSIFYS